MLKYCKVFQFEQSHLRTHCILNYKSGNKFYLGINWADTGSVF